MGIVLVLRTKGYEKLRIVIYRRRQGGGYLFFRLIGGRSMFFIVDDVLFPSTRHPVCEGILISHRVGDKWYFKAENRDSAFFRTRYLPPSSVMIRVDCVRSVPRYPRSFLKR
jgi:hypothetical protein